MSRRKVADVMTRDVISVADDTPFRDIVEVLEEQNVSAVPVVDGGGLVAASTTEACVCDLTDAFTVSGPTISHHLRVLREAGLVDCERRGTWVYYWIRPETMRKLSALLEIAAPAAV